MIAPDAPDEPTTPRDDAAKLVAIDRLTDAEIATSVGVSPATLYRWKREPEFKAKVAEHHADFRERARSSGLAILENRVARLNTDWLKLQRVVEERGASKKMEGVPGGATGLLCHTVKGVGRGDDFRLIDLYEVDTGLLAELRQIEKQAAQELGQWVEKKGVEGDPDKPVFVKVLGNVSLDDL